MGSIGTQEIIIIFIIMLIVFGPRKLPEIGKTIGKGLAEFKKASNELKQTWEDEVKVDKEKAALTSAISESTGNLTEIVSDINKSVDDVVSTVISESTGNLTEVVSDINNSVDGTVSSAIQEEPPKS